MYQESCGMWIDQSVYERSVRNLYHPEYLIQIAPSSTIYGCTSSIWSYRRNIFMLRVLFYVHRSVLVFNYAPQCIRQKPHGLTINSSTITKCLRGTYFSVAKDAIEGLRYIKKLFNRRLQQEGPYWYHYDVTCCAYPLWLEISFGGSLRITVSQNARSGAKLTGARDGWPRARTDTRTKEAKSRREARSRLGR